MSSNEDSSIQIHPLLQKLRTNPIAKPQHGYFENSGGLKLFYRFFEPQTKDPQKVIIGCHGMAGDGEYFILFADQIVEQTGAMFYMMDYRGHGRSEGRKGDIKKFQYYIDDLKEFIDFIKQKHPGISYYLMGESMGGIVSINYIAQNPTEMDGMIEFAPAVKFNLGSFSIKDLFKVIGGLFVYLFSPGARVIYVKGNEALGIRNKIHQQYDWENPYHLEKVSVRYLFQLNKYSKKAYKAADKIKIPIIIFQGSEDKAVSVEGVRSFFEKIQSEDKELVLIPKAYHVLFTDPAAGNLWDKLRDWLKNH